MKEEQLVLYKKYKNLEVLKPIIEILSQHAILYKVEEDKYSFDASFSGNTLLCDYELRIRPTDFSKVDQLMTAMAEQLIADTPSDHYLYDFKDEELMDILLKPDEWSKTDYLLARDILKSRGKTIDDTLLEALRKQRVENLAKPEEMPKAWIVAGYFFAVIGGLFGIFIGIHLFSSKRTLPDGRRIYTFKHEDRKHGLNIIIISSVIFTLMFLSKLYLQLN